MTTAVYYDATGRILRTESARPGQAPPPRDGEFLIYSDDVIMFDHYVHDHVVKPKPPQPSPAHVFNPLQEQWELDVALAADEVRRQRQILLSLCDWTQMPDSPEPQKTAWAAYRQALRDVPQQPGFPAEVDWPVPPT
jgi:hypothetical protein